MTSFLYPFYPDPEDYVGGSFNVTISAGLVNTTLSLITKEDFVVEPDEYFSATLSLPGHGAPDIGVVRSPNVAYVTITDTTRTFEIRIPAFPSSYRSIFLKALYHSTILTGLSIPSFPQPSFQCTSIPPTTL